LFTLLCGPWGRGLGVTSQSIPLEHQPAVAVRDVDALAPKAPGGEFAEVIALLDLSELQRGFLRSRWLGQVVWMEAAAARARRPYYVLRLTTVIGAIVIPALVSINITGVVDAAIGWVTFAVSLLVAASAAVEDALGLGERWRHYRQTAEQLKREGWLFFQLGGPYRRFKSDHAAAYGRFVDRIETLLQREVGTYLADVVREKEEDDEKGEGD
jgi:hypothetical protein